MSDTPTPTPRTDALCNKYAGDPSCMDFCNALESECRTLERELAEVTAQRDRLAEALREISDTTVSNWAKTLSDEALAAVEERNQS